MMNESIKKNTGLTFLFCCSIALSLAAYLIVHPILSKASLLHAVPKTSDDYLNLSFDWWHLVWSATRPVTWLAISICSAMGSRSYFAIMNLLTITYVASVCVFICRLLEVRQVRPLIWFALFFQTFCFEYVVEYYKSTGTLANLCSGNFALLSLHLLLSSFESKKSKVPFWSGVIVFLLSILTKEDFALPIVAFCFFFGFVEASAPSQKDMARKALVLICASGLLVLISQKLIAHNAFLSAQGAYAINLSPQSIMDVARQYLWLLRGSKVAIAVQIGALISVFFIKSDKLRLRFALILMIPFTLVAPFVILPGHICPFYALNWVPWQFFSALALICFPVSPKLNILRLSLFIGLMPFMFLATNRTRHDLLQYYRKEEMLNDNILKTLERNSDALKRKSVVDVLGLSDHSCPWFGQSYYLRNKLNFDCRWIVYVDPYSDFSRIKTQISDDAWPTSIEVRKTAYKGSPFARLRFKNSGDGDFEIPTSER